jgi:hypothetical protein
VISLSSCLFLDSSPHFIVLLEFLLVVKYLIDLFLEHVVVSCYHSCQWFD